MKALISGALLRSYVDLIVNFETADKRKLIVDDVGGKAYLGINIGFNPVEGAKLAALIKGRSYDSLSATEWESCLQVVEKYVRKQIIDRHHIELIDARFQFFFIDTIFHSGIEDESIKALQKSFNKYAPLSDKIVDDGFFGNQTRTAFSSLSNLRSGLILIDFLNYKSQHKRFGKSFSKRFTFRVVHSMLSSSDSVYV